MLERKTWWCHYSTADQGVLIFHIDDSAIRRITLPETFLCADACLNILNNVSAGLVVYPAMIEKHLKDELPSMTVSNVPSYMKQFNTVAHSYGFQTENIIMALSEQGVSRQEAHEEIRKLSLDANLRVKREGKENNLIEQVRQQEFFKPVWGQLDALLDPKSHYGRAPQQVEKFCTTEVQEALRRYVEVSGGNVTVDLQV